MLLIIAQKCLANGVRIPCTLVYTFIMFLKTLEIIKACRDFLLSFDYALRVYRVSQKMVSM